MDEEYDVIVLGTGLKVFVGHTICLYTDDSYKSKEPASEVINRMQLYNASMCLYGKSPYLYPLYGVGELPQGFARLCAVYNGTYMLNMPVQEIVVSASKVTGVKADNKVAKCRMVICDPSYAPSRVKKVGRIYVSSSYDASTNFESTCADVLSMYERITGKPFDSAKNKLASTPPESYAEFAREVFE